MKKFVLKRFFQIIPTLFIVSILVFGAMHLAPGDPASMLMGRAAATNPEGLKALKQKMGLDEPFIFQYFIWLKNVLNGDLGKSNRSGEDVLSLVNERLPASIELLTISFLVSIIFSLPFGIFAALYQNKVLDTVIMTFSVVGVAVPGFWLGLALILLFSVYLKILPASGYIPFFDDPIGNLKRVLLPSITLSVYLIATFSRFLRSDMLNVLNQDYVRTARSKGLTEKLIIIRHSVPNALIPFITIVGVEIGVLLGGMIIVEHVFGWSGLGWLTLQAVYNRDYPLVQGCVMITSLFTLIINFIVDICYAFINPKIRDQYEKDN